MMTEHDNEQYTYIKTVQVMKMLQVQYKKKTENMCKKEKKPEKKTKCKMNKVMFCEALFFSSLALW